MKALVSTGERMIPGLFDPVISIEHLHRYALVIQYCKNKNVLDIACGEGYGSNIISEQASQVTGVDIDIETVRLAAQKYTRANLVFKQGSTDQIPLENASVDTVISFETMEHHDKHEEMLREIKRVLKKNGILVISTPDKKNYSDIPGHKNPFHVKELYADEFRALIKKYFIHAQFLGQRAGTMSALFPLENEGKINPWWFSGDTSKLETHNDGSPVYLLALASDTPIDLAGISFFSDPRFTENIYKQQLEKLSHSATYRAGRLLLAPARWIRAIFSSRK